MSVSVLLEELRRRDVRVWTDGGELRCNAPTGTLTPELRRRLQDWKGEIVRFLRAADTLSGQEVAIVPLRARGERAPVFAVPGHNGDVFCYRALAHHLGDSQPFFGLQPPGVDGAHEPLTRVEALATHFAEQVLAFRPEGPYVIAGYCAGGTVAFELARQLVAQGATVSFLALIAAPYPASFRAAPQLWRRLANQVERVTTHVRALASRSGAERRAYIATKLQERRQRRSAVAPDVPRDVRELRTRIERATVAAIRAYEPGAYEGPVSLFLPAATAIRTVPGAARWRGLAPGIEEHIGRDACDGNELLLEPHARNVAESVRQCLERRAVLAAS